MGWVFKTESVIVPAFLDTLSKSDVLRGLLPVSFRLVQSLAQFFLAQRVSQSPFKQPLFTTSVFGMTLSWLVIAIVAGSGTVAVKRHRRPVSRAVYVSML